jgi:replicative DNA helicase
MTALIKLARDRDAAAEWGRMHVDGPEAIVDPGARHRAARDECERVVVASMLADPHTFEHFDSTEAERFSNPLYRKVWEIATKLSRDRIAVSLLTIKPYLKSDEVDCLHELLRHAVPAESLRGSEKQLRDRHVTCALVAESQAFIESLGTMSLTTSPTSAASEFSDRLQKLSADAADNSAQPVSASALRVLSRVEAIRSGELKDFSVTTGYADLDRKTGGYVAGDLWIVAARPGMGKTTFAVASSSRAARKGNPAMLFSLEVAELQITSRYLADLAYDLSGPIAFNSIMRGGIEQGEFARLQRAQERFAEMPLSVDVTARATLGEIGLKVRAEKRRLARDGQTLRVVFLDYLKFIAASDRYRGQRVYEVGEISGGLKQLAKSEELTMILLCQLNRALEGRHDKRPQLSDLRESGDLEQDADVVAFLHREHYFLEQSTEFRRGDSETVTRALELKNELEIIIGKNRAGPLGTIKLYADMAASHFSSVYSSARYGGLR